MSDTKKETKYNYINDDMAEAEFSSSHPEFEYVLHELGKAKQVARRVRGTFCLLHLL